MQTLKFDTGNAEVPAITFGIGKGRDGWECHTVLQKIRGYYYKISGFKGSRGFYIDMQQVNKKEGSDGYSISLFTAPTYPLFLPTVGTVTEKFVINACEQAAKQFANVIPTLPTKIIYKVGDAFMEGDIILYVLEEMEIEGWELIYRNEAGEVRTTRLEKQHQRFELGDNAEQVQILKSEKDAITNKLREQRKEQEEAAEKLQQQKREIFNQFKPSWAKAAIVAVEREDDSDIQTDYFNYKTVRSVVIGWSGNTRNDFKEMRECAKRFPETEYLHNAGEEVEHRENYSMGAGYYLGKSKYHGWIIDKREIGANGYSFEIPEFLKTAQAAPVQEELSAGSKIAVVKHNQAQNGIELHFDSKPSQDVLDEIKSKGWRWARYNKCWYKKVSSSAVEIACKYGEIPESLLEVVI